MSKLSLPPGCSHPEVAPAEVAPAEAPAAYPNREPIKEWGAAVEQGVVPGGGEMGGPEA